MASLVKIRCCRTEVIVIGNGPSGISLSFLLSGQRPFYNSMRHPNEVLHRKLIENPGVSIVEQDLEYLSEGLEGRSPNPVSLLMDTLTHADADIGADHPSFLTWKKDDAHCVPHVVLGKTAPGGAWQMIEGDMQTLSLSRWMELPSIPFKEWFASKNRSRCTNNNNQYERARIADVRDYYTDFVHTNQLTKFFHNDCTVTSVRKVYNMRTCVDSESGEVEPCCQNVKKNHGYVWEVRGYRTVGSDLDTAREEFCFLAPNVVLATGTFDIANRLNVPGENHPYVLHSMKQYEEVVKRRDASSASQPVVVVGAGLTAGDAVIMSIQNDVPIEHVFRRVARDSHLVYRQLPKALYPEYHRIHAMMKGDDALAATGATVYQAHAAHNIVEFTDDRKVIIANRLGQETILHCSHAVVLVGLKPNLSFMTDKGRNLGVVPKRGIHYAHNPVDINPCSYESVHEPGLFAVGPLVGDTFVRFVKGGALGVANHLWQKRREEGQ